MQIKEMSPEDSQLVIQSLLKQLRETQTIMDEKSRKAKYLAEDLERAQDDEHMTRKALRKILVPLVEERAALYLIHEDDVIRRLAKEILNNSDTVELLEKAYEAKTTYPRMGR